LRVAVKRFPIVITANAIDVAVTVLKCLLEAIKRCLMVSFNRGSCRQGIPGIRCGIVRFGLLGQTQRVIQYLFGFFVFVFVSEDYSQIIHVINVVRVIDTKHLFTQRFQFTKFFLGLGVVTLTHMNLGERKARRHRHEMFLAKNLALNG
jgi:hypothetical protein